jgi:predicted MFS family arabinose efflux permease
MTPIRERWLMLTLAGIQFTHILDFMVMIPLGPQFTKVFDISDAQFGALVSAYTFAAGVSGLLASTYLDRFDRKRLLLGLYSLFALATMACALSQSYGQFMAARIAAGLFGGVLSALSQTIIADVVPFERRGRAMGIVMSSFSVSTVAGVPIGLYLAANWSWHAPFWLVVGLSAVFAVVAALTMPKLDAHLNQPGRGSVLHSILETVRETNHLWAFLFTSLSIMTGFMVIPYITIYVETNVGIASTDIAGLYLVGGLATLVSARVIGVLADKRGKAWIYQRLNWVIALPLFAITLLPHGTPWSVVALVYVLFFVIVSGRMIPASAIMASAANPQRRGTFMALSGASQSMGMALGAVIGGMLISRDANGLVVGYWHTAAVSCVLAWASLWVLKKVTMHTSTPAPMAVEKT